MVHNETKFHIVTVLQSSIPIKCINSTFFFFFYQIHMVVPSLFVISSSLSYSSNSFPPQKKEKTCTFTMTKKKKIYNPHLLPKPYFKHPLKISRVQLELCCVDQRGDTVRSPFLLIIMFMIAARCLMLHISTLQWCEHHQPSNSALLRPSPRHSYGLHHPWCRHSCIMTPISKKYPHNADFMIIVENTYVLLYYFSSFVCDYAMNCV